jgi:hypothetical protein
MNPKGWGSYKSHPRREYQLQFYKELDIHDSLCSRMVLRLSSKMHIYVHDAVCNRRVSQLTFPVFESSPKPIHTYFMFPVVFH